MKAHYTIHEFAKLTNMPISTIKYYDRIGLLHPAYVDKNNHYRYYTLPQGYTLSIIRDLREAGASLSEIKFFLDNQSIALSATYIKKRIEEIDRDIERMRLLRSHLRQKLFAVRTGNSEASMTENISVHHEKRRYGLSFGRRMGGAEDAELAYLELERVLRDEGLTFLGTNVGIIIPKNDLIRGDLLKNSITCLLQNEEEVLSEFADNVFILEEGDYVTAYHQGTFSNRSEILQEMLKYIESHQYTIVGDGIQRVLIDEFITANTEEFKYQIQIPIR